MLIRDKFRTEVANGPVLLVSGASRTKAYADIYKELFLEAWSEVEVEHQSLERAPYLDEAETLASRTLASNRRPKLVVYVGGQTVGDITKVIVHRMREAFRHRKGKRGKVVFGGIITSVSNDGIFSVTASVLDDEGLPRSFPAEAPDFVVGHKLTLLRQPYPMKISCVGDILSKISSLWDYNYSCRILDKYHNDFAADLVKSAYEVPLRIGKITRKYLHDPDSIDALYRAVQLCGLSMQLAGSSETCSGSEHVGQKWLDEYITRYNREPGIESKLPVLSHGEAVTLTSIITLYLQGQADLADQVKAIATEIGLRFTLEDLGLEGRVLQLCLAVGLGFRCPKYLSHLLGGQPLPKGDQDERITVLEEIELKGLPYAIQSAMIDSGVAKTKDFTDLTGIARITMNQVLISSLQHTKGLIIEKMGEKFEKEMGIEKASERAMEIADKVVTELEMLFHQLLPREARPHALAHH